MSQLSFGDRLNIGLFVLTIMSIVLAGWGIYIAHVTLHDAREANAAQKEQFAQEQRDSARASYDQNQQFIRQMGELEKQNQQLDDSGKLLAKATGALTNQTGLLTRLSATAQKQLDKLQAAELRETAQPKPFLLMSCGWTVVLDSREEAEYLAASSGQGPPKLKEVSRKWEVDKQGVGTMPCSIHLNNLGNGDLHIHRMLVSIPRGTCMFVDPETHSDDEKSGVLVSAPDGDPGSQRNFLEDKELPPAAHWAYDVGLTILRINKNCKQFPVIVRLEFNGGVATLHANINTE